MVWLWCRCGCRVIGESLELGKLFLKLWRDDSTTLKKLWNHNFKEVVECGEVVESLTSRQNWTNDRCICHQYVTCDKKIL